MIPSNISVLQGYFDEVVNSKQMDLIPKYISENFKGHGTPYVGMGLMYDASDNERIIIQSIYPGSPADGKLMVGDEIVCAQDGQRVWNTFDTLRIGGLWGQGTLGTPISVWVRRNGTEIEVNLTRGLVPGYTYHYHELKKVTQESFKEWPNLKTQLVNVIESGDMVAYQLEAHGQNVHYGQSAAWSEFGFVRIKDGKITDWWSSEEPVSQYRQLGFTILMPELVKA